MKPRAFAALSIVTVAALVIAIATYASGNRWSQAKVSGAPLFPGLSEQAGIEADVVHTSLVVHHLEPDDAARLLAEMTRVARLGVVVNDLVRGRLAYLGAWLLAHLTTTNAYTRHDAPMSVQRSPASSER